MNFFKIPFIKNMFCVFKRNVSILCKQNICLIGKETDNNLFFILFFFFFFFWGGGVYTLMSTSL